jgi:hypothetical protein
MKRSLNTIIIAACLSLMTAGTGSGQFGDIGLILSGGVDDAELILAEYIRPMANSFGANLNSGWYNSAKVHGTLGFDITFTMSAAFAPDADKLYDIAGMEGLTGIPDDDMAPTVTGEKGRATPIRYDLEDPTGTISVPFSYDHPGGTGVGILPSPMINAAVGLPKGFEIMGRYMPRVKVRGVESGLWGVGIKHDIGQWIPFVKRVPVLHFTFMYGYTNVDVKAKLNGIEPSDINAEDNTSNIDWDDQQFSMVTQGHTANFLIGANLPVVAFYGGVGIATSQVNMKLGGYYPIPTINVDDPLNPYTEVTDESAALGLDPIDIEIKNTDGSIMSPRLNAGLRFKFAVITLHFDYTWANYSVATAGLGISFR